MASSTGDSDPSAHEVGRIFREESGRAVAALIRVFGDIDVAEDAIQEAFAVALETWPRGGLPPNPAAWILTTGKRRAIDRLRRESLGRALLGELVHERTATAEPAALALEPLDDDPLRLIFTCCHPALAPEAQVALTLRLLGGLATRDVAQAFLVEEATMAQRLVRAKRKIKSAAIPYRIPAPEELPLRLPPVLAVTYLIYNGGAGHPGGAPSGGEDLCAEAVRLARLIHSLMPDESAVGGLLALLLFNQSRRRARFAPDGALVPLREQVRADWDRTLIDEAQALLRSVRGTPGPYELQAAIQAVHVEASELVTTDWARIVGLYDDLLRITASPVVALNRAIAVGEVSGPAAALALVEHLGLDSYYLLHATRADLLRRLGRGAEAVEAYRRAADLAPTEAERRFLEARAGEETARHRGAESASPAAAGESPHVVEAPAPPGIAPVRAPRRGSR